MKVPNRSWKGVRERVGSGYTIFSISSLTLRSLLCEDVSLSFLQAKIFSGKCFVSQVIGSYQMPPVYHGQIQV